jgi:single-strand DNA-binding protein
MSDAIIELIGTTTRDFELKFIANGTAVAQTAIAINERKLVDNEWKDGETSYYEVIAWRQLGENAAASIVKGTRIMVKGKLRVREWTREDGTKGKTVEIVADDIGPSLKWATAEVTKNARNGGNGDRAMAGNGGRGGRSAPAGYGPDSTYEVGPGDEPF